MADKTDKNNRNSRTDKQQATEQNRQHTIVVPEKTKGYSGHRNERVQSFIKELAAEFIQRESNHLSLITVTDVIMGEGGHTAMILVSVLPSDKEKGVLEFLHRKRSEFREMFAERARHIKPPTFDFAISRIN